MSIKIETGHNRREKTGRILAAGLLVLMSFHATASVQTTDAGAVEQRSSESLHFSRGGRTNNRNPETGELSVDQYGPLQTAGNRSKTMTSPSAGKSVEGATQSSSFDFWIFDADVILFNDDDGDGYFYGVDLLFDADTIYNSAEVYAAVYLSYEGGPWNEYAVTEDFTIFGASGSDEFVLVTELMSGYPTGEYDLLIELFDAFDGAYVASFGPEDSSELSYLPLEDFNRDAPVVEDRVVIVTQGGGGAFGIWMLFGLFAGRMFARRLA